MQFLLVGDEGFYDAGTTGNKRHLVFRQPCLLILNTVQLGLGQAEGLALNGVWRRPLALPFCSCVSLCQWPNLSVSW